MLFGADTIEWVVSFWAVIDAGVIVVLGNGWWSRAEARRCG
jgi:long-chain acyl-CoA synthetase